jgi:hypothetical protein
LLRSGGEPFFMDGARNDMRQAHVNAVEIKHCLRACAVTSVMSRANGELELICQGETRQREKMEVELRIGSSEKVPILRVRMVSLLTRRKEEL